MNDIDVVDLESLRKKYLGARLDRQSGAWAAEFTVQDSDYNEYTYSMDIEVGEDGVIEKISEPYCQVLEGDDATRSTYREQSMDSWGYSNVDDWLEDQIEEDEV